MANDPGSRHTGSDRSTAAVPAPDLNALWDAAAELRGEGPLDVSRVVERARANGTVVRWRDFAYLAMADRWGGLGRPLYLLDFLAELAERTAPGSVFDPYVTSPTPLVAIADAVPRARVVGLVRDPRVRDIGEIITSNVEWRSVDYLAPRVDEGRERYDFVLLAPPLGMREPADLRTTPAGTDTAGSLLWQLRNRLTGRGRLVFHTSDRLFGESGERLRAECAAEGLHLTAVISVDAGFAPGSSTASSLALFESQPTETLFIGRLDARTPIPELVRNLLARKPNRVNFHLGALSSSDYRGWAAFVAQRELADAFSSEHLQSIGDLGQVRTLNLRSSRPHEARPNAVYVPTLGSGDVHTSLPDIQGKRVYRLIEIQLDPSKARAEYVAALLSSPVGRRLRETIATGSTIPSIKASLLAGLHIPLPPVVVQQEAISASNHLASMEAAVARLRADLWRHPEQARRIIERLESAAKADPVRRWMDALPYPLASVLQRYAVSRDPDARVQSLLNFFEVTAEFACAILLSVFRADIELFGQVQTDLNKAAPPGRQLFDRADFGLWLGLGQTLARNVRRLSSDTDSKGLLAETAAPAGVLVRKLSEKAFWASLDSARRIRNQRAHGGIMNADQVASWLGTLEVQIGQLEQVLGDAFEDVDLAFVEEGRYKNGVYTYGQAQRLRGVNAMFEQFELRTREPLESGQLTFVSRDVAISPALRLVPLVRIGPSKSRTRHACYFFESRHEGAVSYVSYHYEDEPRIELHDDDLERLALQFESTADPLNDQ